MRFYTDARDMYSETERDLKEMGISYVSKTVQDKEVNADTKELLGHAYRLEMVPGLVTDLETLAMEKGIPRAWMIAEIGERLYQCVNPGRAWIYREDLWRQYLRNGRFSYTYSERLFNQYAKILQELKTKKDTRQAVLTMFWPTDLDQLGGVDRVPCSLTYQFICRDDELFLIYTMRSCDFYKFFLFDLLFACTLLEDFGRQLDKDPKFIQHQIGSLHAFEEDLKDVY